MPSLCNSDCILDSSKATGQVELFFSTRTCSSKRTWHMMPVTLFPDSKAFSRSLSCTTTKLPFLIQRILLNLDGSKHSVLVAFASSTSIMLEPRKETTLLIVWPGSRSKRLCNAPCFNFFLPPPGMLSMHVRLLYTLLEGSGVFSSLSIAVVPAPIKKVVYRDQLTLLEGLEVKLRLL
eukprot:c20363_g1_i2 orf=939-1472(+)